MTKLPLALLMCAILAGCAPMHDGPTPTPRLDGAHVDLVDTAVTWPTDTWWTRYGDPQLNALVEEALRNSPSLSRAQARLAQANAAVGSARSALLPSVAADYQLTRQRLSENYIYPAPLAGSITTDQRLALDFSYEIDFWGKNRSAFDAAIAGQQASAADAQAARVVLTGGVVQAYLNLQNAFAQHAVLTDIIKQNSEVLDITRNRFTNGLDTQVEVRQAESQLAATRVEQTQAETRIAQLRNQVAALTGAGPSRGASLMPAQLTRPAGVLPTQLPLELLGRRPEIVAARWRAEAATKNIDVAKALFFPNVDLTAFVGFQALGLHNLLQGSSRAAGVGPAITLPIFQGGALNANLAGQRAAADEATADYNEAVVNAVNQVADVLDALRLLDREREAQTQARTAIDAAYALARDRYRAGLGNYLVVLIAQNSVMTQALRDTDLRMRAYLLDAQLARALGGGYATPSGTIATRPAPLSADASSASAR
jgi:NodT family efflux transporter outer membrane factor (OMF) lipoprotein